MQWFILVPHRMHRIFVVVIAMSQEGELLPLQGAWNEVYSGYGAYTKSTAHRRGNSLDDMDIGSIEDTRGQQIENGARVGMEIAQLTS